MQKKLLLIILVTLTNIYASEQKKDKTIKTEKKQSAFVTLLLTLSIQKEIIQELLAPKSSQQIIIQTPYKPKHYKPVPKYDKNVRRKQVNRRIQQYRRR